MSTMINRLKTPELYGGLKHTVNLAQINLPPYRLILTVTATKNPLHGHS